MCHLFAHQPQRDYESQTRSLRIDGHCTSIRLEMSFWDTLEEIAAKEGMTLAKFLTTLHNEVLDHHGEVNNFASLLRCSCLIYPRQGQCAGCRPGLSSGGCGDHGCGGIEFPPIRCAKEKRPLSELDKGRFS
ncbi:putative DNA-binding ribbon-helix-helix protein [Bradyrhizobium sp. JR6.1]